MIPDPKPRMLAADHDPRALVSGSVSSKPNLAIYVGPDESAGTAQHDVSHDSGDNQEDATPKAKEQLSQRAAAIYLLVAWLLGTILFETIAFGFEACMQYPTDDIDNYDVSVPGPLRELPFAKSMRREATEISLVNSGIESFVRLDRNRNLCQIFDEIIRAETIRIAMLESKRSIRRPSSAVQVDPDVIVLDPVVGSMPITKADVTDAYRKLETSRDHLSLKARAFVRLAWDDATRSSLPGLVRLAANETSDWTRQSIVLDPAIDTSETTKSGDTVAKPAAAISSTPPTGTGEMSRTDESPQDSTPVHDTSSPTTFMAPESAARIVRARPHVLPSVAPPTTTRTSYVVDTVKEEASESTADPPRPEFSDQSNQYSAEPLVLVMVDNVVEEFVSEPDSATPSSPGLTTVSPQLSSPEVSPTSGTSSGHQPVTIALNPPATTDQAAGEPPIRIATTWPFATENAETVTLNVTDTDVRAVLEMLARGYQMNILVAPEVSGTITANVDGLTPEQTLEGVLKMCKLKAQREGELIYVYPGDQLPAESREVRLFPLDFARAEALEPTVQGLLSPIGNAYVTQIQVDDNLKTNETIVVVDSWDAISRIENYILQADRAPRQVMIEAHILEVDLSDDMRHGINFEAIFSGNLKLGSVGIADAITTSQSNPLFFAEIDGSRVNALIEFIEKTTDSKTLASPRVMVVNGQNAKIQVGQQLGFTVATVTQTSTIQDVKFLDTGVVLNVIPTISRDDQIMMQVKPEVSDGQINPDTLLPEEETRELETSILLGNHQGMVIGGLIQEKDRIAIQKLPWLGDIKHVGKLFQRRELERSRSEIIVALVPHIVEPCIHRERDAIEYERATTPLLHGPLQRAFRPWEASLPDVTGEERHLDAAEVNRMISR